MVGRCRAVRPPLPKAELDQHLCPRCRIKLLLERAGEIADRGLGRPWASERRPPATASRPQTHRPWGNAQQVPGRTLRRGAGLEQQFGGRAMRGVSLDHIQRLVDGAADDGVEELERILATEEVEPNEGGGGRAKLTCCQVGERRRVTQLGPVAQDRGRAGAGPAPPAAAERGGARRPEKRPARRFPADAPALGGRAGSLQATASSTAPTKSGLPPVAVSRAAQKVSSGSRPCSSREHRDRATPKRLGANRGDLRVGDQLGDKDGIVALALGGRVPRRRGAALPPAFASGTAATAGGSVRPLQIIDGEQRRPLQGHVGREPVEAVDDREGPLRPRPGNRRAARLPTATR